MKRKQRTGEMRATHTDAAARKITAAENEGQHFKTERLRAARLNRDAGGYEVLDEKSLVDARVRPKRPPVKRP